MKLNLLVLDVRTNKIGQIRRQRNAAQCIPTPLQILKNGFRVTSNQY